MRQAMSLIIVGSMSALLAYVLFIVGKITVVGTTIRRNQESCDEPLKGWLSGMLLLDCVNFLLALRTLLRTYYADDHERSKWAGGIETLYRISYFLWQVLGNYLYYSEEDCEEQAPELMKLMFWLLVLAYLYYSWPCLGACGFILCLPVAFLFFRRFRITLTHGATESQLQSINEFLIESEEGTECPICTVPFTLGERVHQMPCDDRHLFHKECLSNWLRIKADCPICRTQL